MSLLDAIRALRARPPAAEPGVPRCWGFAVESPEDRLAREDAERRLIAEGITPAPIRPVRSW
jgi:hypothetical protein